MPKASFFAMDIFRTKHERLLIQPLRWNGMFHVKRFFAFNESVSRGTSSSFCLDGKHSQK
ncbi:hypothetical protein EBR21_11265 [bacterium]|nr:hypothetical protein [bacterium]